MTTRNKYPQACKRCGEIVPAGEGRLYQGWSNEDDDVLWMVEHIDAEICKRVEEDVRRRAALARALQAVINYIRRNASPVAAGMPSADNRTIIYDGRRNHVGNTVQTDAAGVLYLVFHDPTTDGMGPSHQTLAEYDDEGFGNSNADIVAALAAILSGQVVDVTPFKE